MPVDFQVPKLNLRQKFGLQPHPQLSEVQLKEKAQHLDAQGTAHESIRTILDISQTKLDELLGEN